MKFNTILKKLVEGTKDPKSDEKYNKVDAARKWGVDVESVIHPANTSGRGINKKLWLNDETGETVYAS